jgi:hypothetical protein
MLNIILIFSALFIAAAICMFGLFFHFIRNWNDGAG